jgi:hypothetical protein
MAMISAVNVLLEPTSTVDTREVFRRALLFVLLLYSTECLSNRLNFSNSALKMWS